MQIKKHHEEQVTEFNYYDDAKLYIDIRKRYDSLQENDIEGAYTLMKDSLAVYDRWSKILFDIRKGEKRETRDPALKNRIEDMCKILREINQECRMIWNKSENDYKRVH